MITYSYQKPSVIDKVTFEKSEGGAIRAYLHAYTNTDNAKLIDISKTLSERGWQNIPATYYKKPMLEVRGFGNEKKLLKELIQQGFIEGEAQIEKTKEKPVSFISQVKKRSLQTSGLFFLAADAAYSIYGYKKGHWQDMLAGAMYFGGSATLLAYGNHDNSQIEIHDLAKKMHAEVKKQAINLPENCSLSVIARDQERGILKSADDLLRRYPSEIMNTFFGLAGASIAASALRHNIYAKPPKGWNNEQIKRQKNEGWMDVGLGGMTMSSGALSAIVEEKARDPDAPKKHGLDAIWEWIQERPLAIAGAGYIISTCCHAASSYSSMKSAKINNDETMKKSIPFRIAFVGANLIAEILMMFSSKGHGKGVISDKSVNNTAISLAGELISTQPAKTHDILIDYMSGFLGRNDVLAMKDNEVKELLKTQVELMKKNPWAQCSKPIDTQSQITKRTSTLDNDHKTKWQAITNSSQNQRQPTPLI